MSPFTARGQSAWGNRYAEGELEDFEVLELAAQDATLLGELNVRSTDDAPIRMNDAKNLQKAYSYFLRHTLKTFQTTPRSWAEDVRSKVRYTKDA